MPIAWGYDYRAQHLRRCFAWPMQDQYRTQLHFCPGRVGVVARSGTLSYEIVGNLSAADIGQSTVIGIGGDRVVGQSFVDILRLFEADAATAAVVLVGEIGGSAEEEAARYIEQMTKPVVAYIAGQSPLASAWGMPEPLLNAAKVPIAINARP